MKKNEIFFSDEGLTSSNANHISNISKEVISEIQSEIDNIRFVGCQVGLLSSNNQTIIERSSDPTILQKINDKLCAIGDLTSLIAWLREGIKAKENESGLLPSHLKDYCDLVGKVMPKEAYRDRLFSEDDIVAEMSIKDRSRYYTLEAKASVIGKYIHPDGKFSKARETLKDKTRNPVSIQGQGIDAIVRTYNDMFDIEKVDDKFFELQQIHRTLQSELNGIKYSIKTETEKRNSAVNTEYLHNITTFNGIIKELSTEMENYIKSEKARIESLKIIIPNDLKPIYEYVNSLGKKK